MLDHSFLYYVRHYSDKDLAVSDEELSDILYSMNLDRQKVTHDSFFTLFSRRTSIDDVIKNLNELKDKGVTYLVPSADECCFRIIKNEDEYDPEYYSRLGEEAYNKIKVIQRNDIKHLTHKEQELVAQLAEVRSRIKSCSTDNK